MSSELQRTGYRHSAYERPGRRWECGYMTAGRPCPVGPDRRGRCTAQRQSICVPRREGDRWLCARPAPYGGPCTDGPLPNGDCCRPQPQHQRCRPRRSLRARRGALTAALAVASLGLALMLLDGRFHLPWIAPGDLSTAHAAIAKPSPTNCGACHSAAGEGPHDWLKLSFAAPVSSDSRRCLECHFHNLIPSVALADHSVENGMLADFSAGAADLRHSWAALWGAPKRPSGLACARCHQEHQGQLADITEMSDVRCQSCHRDRFSGFSPAHPTLTAPIKPPSLAFDHVQHRPYWPEEKLLCSDCHALDADGGRMSTAGYRQACGGCHSQGQTDFHGFAIKRRAHTVLQPPDMEFADDTSWPVASGVLVSPLMWMLLAGDEQVMDSLEDLFSLDDLGLEAEPFEWYPDEEALKREFALGFYRLLSDLAGGDVEALASRLAQSTGLAAGDGKIAAFVDQLLGGQFALQAYRARWYGDGAQEAVQWSQAKAAGGWLVDGDEVAVQYRPTGHGDNFARAWVELLRALPDPEEASFRSRLLDEIRSRLLSPGGWLYQTCVECHQQDGARGSDMNWTQQNGRTPDSGYFKFTHRSHFDIRQGNENCTGCHRLAEQGGPSRGFALYERERCGQCHGGDLAPENCLHCHNYHFARP